jgi:hypothetical protein
MAVKKVQFGKSGKLFDFREGGCSVVGVKALHRRKELLGFDQVVRVRTMSTRRNDDL